jgi:hypothetical protein
LVRELDAATSRIEAIIAAVPAPDPAEQETYCNGKRAAS